MPTDGAVALQQSRVLMQQERFDEAEQMAKHAQALKDRWPLFGGPFVEAALDSGQLILKYGKMRRILDFRRLTVTDTP